MFFSMFSSSLTAVFEVSAIAAGVPGGAGASAIAAGVPGGAF